MNNFRMRIVLCVLLLPFCTRQFSLAGDSGIVIASSPSVKSLAIDPLGRRTGQEGYRSTRLNEIPGSSYVLETIGELGGSEVTSSRHVTIGFGGSDGVVNGTYVIKIFGLADGPFFLDAYVYREPKGDNLKIRGYMRLGQVRTYLLTYSADTTQAIRIDSVMPSIQVKGGVFNPAGARTLSVRAKPSVSFGSADTLRCLTATLRWQSRFPLNLEGVTSSYGFARLGSDTTVGSYRYQRFRTTTPAALNWSAGSEYELFTVNMTGNTGAGVCELTNALPGVEWYVDVNYLDKTDSVFYRSSTTLMK